MAFKSSYVLWVAALMILCGAIAGGYVVWSYDQKKPVMEVAYKTPEESDKYVRFAMEGYDIIQSNYWQKATDSDLSTVYLAAVQKFASSTLTLTTNDRAGVASLVHAAILGIPETERVKMAETILGAVLYNIAPVGRNQLMTSVAHKALLNTVNNVHPEKDLYQNLGVEKGASVASVEQAYDAKKAELEATSSPQAAEELEKIDYAKTVLTDTDAKVNYDQAGVEPTVFAFLSNPSTLYVYITSMSPATEAEFEDVIRKQVKSGVKNMILDLRGNIGGDLTTSLTFLGLFAGPNAYAYDFFHLGKYEAQRTLGLGAMAELKQIREIAILTDGMTQSTAEVITAAMKKQNLGVSVGAKTRGWGSVEGQYPMKTVIDESGQHAILLVVQLSVRDDQQPIEGQGVLPDIDISAADWKEKLSQHFFSPELISAIKKQIALPPQKTKP